MDAKLIAAIARSKAAPVAAVKTPNPVSNYFIACVANTLAKADVDQSVPYGVRKETWKAQLKAECADPAVYAELRAQFPQFPEAPKQSDQSDLKRLLKGMRI